MAGRVAATCACAFGINLALCAAAFAQAGAPTAAEPGRMVQIERRAIAQGGAQGGWTSAAPLSPDFQVLAGPVELGATVVKDAPYSADAVTEVVQVLADGNRIVRSTSAAVHRDSAGRMRREQSLPVIGALVGGAGEMREVVITDPDRGVTYILNEAARTARRLRMPTLSAAPALSGVPASPNGPGAPPAPGSGGDVLFFETTAPPPGTPDAPVPPGAVPPPPPGAQGEVVFFQYSAAAPAAGVVNLTATRHEAPATDDRTESLGTQSIEGVQADGTRSTRSIPAGRIGNERPIDIVSERWTSPELKVLVLSRQSDPRFGETTYRLANIVRAEPDASLFEVPSDYEIVDGGGARDMLFFRGNNAPRP